MRARGPRHGFGWAPRSVADYPRARDRTEGPPSRPRPCAPPVPLGSRHRPDRRGPGHRRRRGRGPRRGVRGARRPRPGAHAGGARRHRGPRRGRRRRLRRDDRFRRPRLHVHRAGPGRAAPGEPPDEPRGGRRRAVPPRDRPGDARPARQHARPGPQRLPAADRGPPARVPRRGDPPGRPGAGQSRRLGRPGAARPPGAAADRAGPRRVPRPGAAGAAGPARGRPGAAHPRGQGRAWRSSTERR